MSAWLTARRLAGAALFVSLVSSSIASAQAPRPGAPALYHADSDYDRARALLDARLYAQAAEAFLDFRRAYPAGPRAPEALYYAAEATLASGDEALAADLFGQFRHTYPAHVLAGRSGLALATFYYETGRYAEAEEALLNALDSPLPDARAAHAYYLLGQTTLAQEHPERAVPYFLQSAAQYPDVPTAPAALYAAGTVQVEEEDWTGAAETFSILAERYPDSPQDAQAGLGLAEALARLGRSEEAIDELARRVPLLDDEELARGHLLWGDALLRLDRYDEARDHFQSVPAESSFARRARFGLARIDFDHERWAAASEGFAAVRQALGDAPDDNLSHTATYYEGLALKQLGQLGEAERRLAAVTLRRPDGPFAAAALLEAGILRYERRQYQEAASAFSRVLDAYASSPYVGEAARMLGETYAALGDTGRARDAYRRAEALGAAPLELGVEVDFQDAYARYGRGDYAEAIPALLAVVESDPTGPRAGEALFWAGESAFQTGDHGAAQRLLRRFLQQHPGHRQADAARYVLAWSYFEQRDYAEASAGFERFLSSYTRSAESVPYYADALLRLGDSYYALRRFDDAARVYQRAAGRAESGGRDYALFQSGQVLAAAGRLDDALATFDQVLEDFPRSPLRPQVLYARGFAFFQQAQYAAAIDEYRALVDAHSQSPLAPKALYGIGDAHYNEGRLEEAEKAYRRVLTRYPDSPFVTNAVDGLSYTLDGLGRRDEIEPILEDIEARRASRRSSAGE